MTFIEAGVGGPVVGSLSRSPVPTRFVLCTEDRFFPPEFMRRVVADRLGIVPDEIAAGHAVALSRPKELASLLVSHLP
jgi:pimeloyl-ACP methyl ester carboxylesterase